MELKSGTTVTTTKKYTIDDPFVEGIFIRNRKNTTDSVVDSPIHYNFNKLWLVKHSNSGLVRGISIGYYAVYHEDELEIIEAPPTPEIEDEEDDDDDFNY